ncbi:MAG: DUF4340 domain-containing protein [Spirochaetaceae bacterium]|jgi:hypothetical protein|nr:DUF4340 domain-containing protein [Spirochaetaceae bacterium]
MTFKTSFKQKLLIRASITLALALVLAATFIFSPDRVSGRQSAYAWMENRLAAEAGRVEIKGETEINLVRRDNGWFVENSGKEYPAKPDMVEDLFNALTARGVYALRGNAASSHESLGLDGETASRITVSGGPGEAAFLDLLIGSSDATGREVYYRKAGQDEIRSGDNSIAAFLSYPLPSWYDLKIFPDSGNLDTGQVYRLTLIAPPPGGNNESGENDAGGGAPAPLVILRAGEGWTVEGLEPGGTDMGRVETFIRQVLDTSADDYVPEMNAGEAVFNEGRILIEFSGLPARTIRLGPPLSFNEEDGSVTRRSAVRNDSPYVFALSSWNLTRLFRDRDYFKLP